MRVIQEIPDTMITRHYPAEQAAVSTWLSFKTGKVQEAIRTSAEAAGKAGVKTLILDVSAKLGVMATSDMKFTNEEGPVLVRRAGIQALVNVLGADVMTRLGSKSWTKAAEQSGVPIYQCATIEEALSLARKVAAGEPVSA